MSLYLAKKVSPRAFGAIKFSLIYRLLILVVHKLTSLKQIFFILLQLRAYLRNTNIAVAVVVIYGSVILSYRPLDVSAYGLFTSCTRSDGLHF